MRQEQLKLRESFDIVDIAELWPRADGAGSPPLAEVEAAFAHAPTPAVPDLPPAVGRLIVGVYGTLLAVFLVTMGRSAEAAFMIAISALYLAVFLAVPSLFLKVEADASKRPDLARFMARGIDTNTGHMSGASALGQIFAVPVLLTLAILVMGLAALWYLP